MPRFFLCSLCLLAVALLPGCFAVLPSSGGGQIPPVAASRTADSDDVALPEGYEAEVFATGLTFPTGVTFDDEGGVYIIEAGYSYGEEWATPRLLKLRPTGPEAVFSGRKNGPWTGVWWSAGHFYIAEGGQMEGGRILRVSPVGQAETVVDNLPGKGDHHTDGPVIGPDGFLYFGQGTATNSGVVGPDNATFGWLKRFPRFHDVPCRDVKLAGRNFTADDLLQGEGKKTTGAFSPFGTPTGSGETIRGNVPCSGAVMRVRPQGGTPELVAWGFRNPFGLAFDPSGRLFVTDNSYDSRGSRPVFGAGDLLWEVREGRWYGWPDFHGDRRLDEGDAYGEPFGKKPEPLLAEHPARPPKPAAVLPVHASACGFDFSRNPSFGHVGEAFVALFGDEAPTTGKVLAPVGFKVVRVDPKTGATEDFAVNRGSRNGPASAIGGKGMERPVAARFDPAGTSLYVVDFGILRQDAGGARPERGTGVVWRVTRKKVADAPTSHQ